MSERVVLITGASRGIGAAIAREYAQEGFFVWVHCHRNMDAAQKLAEDLVSQGAKAKAIAFDVADTDAVTKGFAEIESETGGLDVLINNAGISIDALALRAKPEDWDKLVGTNLTGSFLVTKSALKTLMKRRSNGRIIFISSVVGQSGNVGQSMYAATKSGLMGMAKSLAQEVASRQITVNVVAPGFVKTDMTENMSDAQKEGLLKRIPLGRCAEPEEIGKVVRFLSSENAAYITGQVIGVNGGMYL